MYHLGKHRHMHLRILNHTVFYLRDLISSFRRVARRESSANKLQHLRVVPPFWCGREAEVFRLLGANGRRDPRAGSLRRLQFGSRGRHCSRTCPTARQRRRRAAGDASEAVRSAAERQKPAKASESVKGRVLSVWDALKGPQNTKEEPEPSQNPTERPPRRVTR